jgi:hypothetical protein
MYHHELKRAGRFALNNPPKRSAIDTLLGAATSIFHNEQFRVTTNIPTIQLPKQYNVISHRL